MVHLDVRCDISEQYVVESVMRRRKVQLGVKYNISGQKTRSREVHPGVKYDISGHKCDERTKSAHRRKI